MNKGAMAYIEEANKINLTHCYRLRKLSMVTDLDGIHG